MKLHQQLQEQDLDAPWVCCMLGVAAVHLLCSTAEELEIISDSPCQEADREARCWDPHSDQQLHHKYKTWKPQLEAVHISQLSSLKTKKWILTADCKDPRRIHMLLL